METSKSLPLPNNVRCFDHVTNIALSLSLSLEVGLCGAQLYPSDDPFPRGGKNLVLTVVFSVDL